ncbi:MAG: hypothetical protein HWN81_07890 [Candidatus Lokiarchaeota archaeon]|nr:hypothetical protein [Candidatus Lokiarchaeota archaeon]
MKSRKREKGDSRSINFVLLAVSFIIFGVLGIVFVTQMELQPGWTWEDIGDTYPIELYSFETEDINNNGNNEIISYADIRGTDDPEYYSTIQYGGIYCLEGSNGKPLWIKEYDGPVKRVFQIMDISGDGLKDYFISKASISPNWKEQEHDGTISYQPKILPNLYTNQLIDGNNGNDLLISTGDGINFTNFYVHDLVSIEDLTDQREDLIMLESKATEIIEEDHTWFEYNTSLSSYFINGTKTKSIPISVGDIWEEYNVPGLELFEYYGNPHLLYIGKGSLILFNISEFNFLEPIYNFTFTKEIINFAIIEDLNLDGISEILASRWDGNMSLINGVNGEILREFPILPEDLILEEVNLDINFEELHSAEGDGFSYFLINSVINYYGEGMEDRIMQVYTFDLTSEHVTWEIIKSGTDVEAETFVLNEDLNGDSIDEIIYHERYEPLISYSDVRRFTILSAIDGQEFAILNTEYFADSIITKSDIDGDGKKDFAISGDDRVIVLSSSKPRGLWLSSAFPLGLPLFIVLAVLLGIGIIILILKGKSVSYHRQNIKEHKLTIAVTTLAILLMTITFLLFLILMNIFNNTLVTGSNNTNIVLVFIIVTIIWYGTLPLTAALFNRFAPQFAYIFIKLRDLFFKISKGYKNDIIVLDLGEKKEIGITIQLKRLILPLLLSIAVGFYAYDTLTTWFGYPQEFEIFGSTEFFDFMVGYMLCCVLPMILSFVLFSFFISGNYLLDDAGIVYYRENKKYRQPGDIEPISIWSQSIIKGIAGLSALLTFGNFLGAVDFSGFFEIGEGGAFGIVFGLLLIIVMFGGIPFLTAFSYILLAGEVMELNVEKNIQKLFGIMENNGYDTKPREITNIYPSGYESPKSDTPIEKENPDASLSD